MREHTKQKFKKQLIEYLKENPNGVSANDIANHLNNNSITRLGITTREVCAVLRSKRDFSMISSKSGKNNAKYYFLKEEFYEEEKR